MSLQAICRVCTCENARLLSIFDSYNFTMRHCEIFKVITECASVQIEQFDGFPKKICTKCLVNLSQAYSFKKLCEESDYKFRNDLIASCGIEVKSELLEDDARIAFADFDDHLDPNEISDADFGLTEVKTELCDDENKSDKDRDEAQSDGLDAAIFSSGVFKLLKGVDREEATSPKELQCAENDSSCKPAQNFENIFCNTSQNILDGSSAVKLQARQEHTFTYDLMDEIDIKSEFSEDETLITKNASLEQGDDEELDDSRLSSDAFSFSDCKQPSDLKKSECIEIDDISAKLASFNALPENTRKKYDMNYKVFKDWQERQQTDSVSESVLMTYFDELSKKYKASTLWAQYSMLRTHLNINNNVDIATYLKLRAFLKGQWDGYCPKKSKMFTSAEISRFLKEAPDVDFLMTKVALIMGIMGACRRHELHQMSTKNVNDLGTALLVTLPNTKTKVRKFTITGHFYELYKKYAKLRPPNANNPYFFLNYRNGRCTAEKVGINKFGAMGKQIAKYLNLPNPESYTAHCFRKFTKGYIEQDDEVSTENVVDKDEIEEEAIFSSNYGESSGSKCTRVSDIIEPTRLSVLPELSRKKYEVSYNIFMDWRKEHGATSFSENVLMSYFGEIAQKYKASSLWTQYSMLRTYLSINHDADISKYLKLKAFLKQKSEGYRPKKSKIFEPHEINKFLTEAPDSKYLLTKVALIMGVMGACRRQQLHQMSTKNINDLGSAVVVKIPDPKTKVMRKFTLTGHFYSIFKKYANLRPPNAKGTCFFLNYQKEKCTVQKVGINKFGAMGKEIAKYLKLPSPELYTGHCFRRSFAPVVDSSDIFDGCS